MQSQKSRSATPRSAARLKLLSVRMLCIATASTLLTACATSTRPSPVAVSPLVTASCPELTPLTDDSFGATTMKLNEVASIYRECRAAALAEKAAPKYNEQK